MPSSQEREVGFKANLRKRRKELEETERMNIEGLKRRENAFGAKGSVDEVRALRLQVKQTAGSQNEGNGENQFPEELCKERDGGENRRAEER